MGLMVDYSWIWNVLEYPSGIVTVTQVQEDEQFFEDSHNDGWTKFIDKSSKNSKGMPIGIQVVAHSFEDEKALAIMKSIDDQI